MLKDAIISSLNRFDCPLALVHHPTVDAAAMVQRGLVARSVTPSTKGVEAGVAHSVLLSW